MATYGTGLEIGEFEAATELNAFSFAVISQKKVQKPQAGQYADGVTFESIKPGQPVRLRFAGTIKVVCGAPIKDGDFITTDANGCAVVAGDGNWVLGKALDNAVQGQLIEILLIKMKMPEKQTPPPTPPAK